MYAKAVSSAHQGMVHFFFSTSCQLVISFSHVFKHDVRANTATAAL